jgi:hypothetical protein
MGDVSVKDARESWPAKALWLNFTGAMHIEPDDVIEEHSRELLEQAGSKREFAISVTEDAPPEDLERCLTTIMQVVREHR